MPSALSRLHAARNLLRAGDTDAAWTALEEIPSGDFATYHLVRAELLYAQHKYAEAKHECERALDASPNSPRAAILIELTNEMLTLNQWVQPQREAAALVTESVEMPKLKRQSPPAPLPSEPADVDEKPALV